MSPADRGLQIPERKDAPGVDDPAVVAGNEAKEAAAAFSAIAKTCRTSDDENTPEFVAADKRTTEADAAFADAPVTSIAGALAKMREIVDLSSDDDSTSLDSRHIKTVAAFLEGFAGAPSAVDDDPAVVALAEFKVAKAADDAIPNEDAEAGTPEYIAISDQYYTAADAVFAAVPTSMAGMAAKIRFIFDYQERGNDLWPGFDEMAKPMMPFLEDGAAAAPLTATEPDPAVVAFAELKAAWAAFDGLGDEEPGHGIKGDPRHAAAYERYAAARDAVRDAVPVSLAGVAGKVRAMLEPYRADADAVGLDHDYDIAAKAMLPFLEGGAAAVPDPVTALFAKWGEIRDEATALSAADPKATDPEINERWENAISRCDAVEDQIMETPATSMRGVAIKIRLASHYVFGAGDLDKRYATPARDIDYVEATGGPLDADGSYVISALLDAERLAGVS